tara:strand:- start:270 stop:944 length:675 start_codon:yes stop_codon:yes gene_type:complete
MTVILDGQRSDEDAPKQTLDQKNHPNNNFPYSSHLWSPFWYWTNIPIPICDLILNTCKKSQGEEYDSSGVIEGHKSDNNFRQSDIVFRQVEWVNALMFGYIHRANYYNFGYDLSKVDYEEIQMTKYKKGDYYKKHIDFGFDRDQLAHTRKLSSTLQLSDSNEYEGGDFILHIDGFVQHESVVKVPRSKGTLIVFDSRVPHEVTPVTSGNRYSVVKWVCGDKPLQ